MSPGLVASTPQPHTDGELSPPPATSLTASGPILIPDSDDEDEKGKGKYPIGSVIVIGDSDDDSTIPYPSYPSHVKNLKIIFENYFLLSESTLEHFEVSTNDSDAKIFEFKTLSWVLKANFFNTNHFNNIFALKILL